MTMRCLNLRLRLEPMRLRSFSWRWDIWYIAIILSTRRKVKIEKWFRFATLTSDILIRWPFIYNYLILLNGIFYLLSFTLNTSFDIREIKLRLLLYIIRSRMGKFTKDKRVTRNIQYSNHVHHNCHPNLGYLLSQGQVVVLSGQIRL